MPYEIRILELSGPDEILPGIVCEAAGGHTEGSMNVNVETAAIKKALNSGTFVLPIHDWPARVESGRIASRLVGGSVPGPEQPVDHRTTAETGAMGLGAERFWV